MLNSQKFICPVCGFDGLNEPAHDNHGCGSFEICPSCGTEFGYDDSKRSHGELRQAWLNSGAKWNGRAATPPASCGDTSSDTNSTAIILQALGKAGIKRPGKDVTIVSYNKMMKISLAAAADLEKENISAEVIDLRTIRPLDWMTVLESVKKTNRLVIVEEQWPFASVSSEIAYTIQKEGFDYLDAPIRRLTAADAPLHYAGNLVAAAMPSTEKVVRMVKEVMYLNK